jgi:hypothetical protein|tara:strand:- start:163 stop:987 length:825 start_codon:yes stop_codon:yes gene_type:complete
MRAAFLEGVWFMRFKNVAVLGAVAVGLMSAPVMAGDKPAVSAINGKVEAIGGELNDSQLWAAAGSVAVPISGQFGAQVDGILADYSASDTYGIGLHGFWRDPEIGLAGIVVSHTDIGGTDINRYAAEGEYYLNNLTFAGTAGYQSGDSLETGFGAADIRWYATDDLMVEVGASTISQARVGHIGVEWKAPVRFAGVSLFADGAIGTDSYDHVIGGIRIYFGGGDKSLKRRHREDDPINSLVTGVASAVSGTAGASSTSSGTLGSSCVPGPGAPC